jgi:PAS domain S-box-containing protein
MRSDPSKRDPNKVGKTTAEMQAVLETAPDGVLLTDEQRKITAWNPHFLEIWKITQEQLASGDLQKVLELIAQKLKDPDQYLRSISEMETARGKTSQLLELKDGRFFEQHSKAVFLEEKIVGRVWFFTSVTERHHSDLLARRLAAIVDNSDDAIIGKNLNSIITSWNQGAQKIFGYSADEMIGTSIMRLIPPERQDEEEAILARLRRGERYDHFETVRITKDGRKLDVSLTISPIKDAHGNVIGASKIARDISGRKAAQQALVHAKRIAEAATSRQRDLLERERTAREEAERANRIKDEFLATLSHELRTPLNAILGWATVLRTTRLQGEEREKGVDAIERNARVQAQIINDLLDMSRIMSGKVRLDVQRLDLSSIVSEAIETLSPSASAKGIRLQPILDPMDVAVSGDPNRLRQVFWNLLNNAIKFTPKGGRVQVVLERVDSHVELSVTDTGEGISADFLPYIFNRFQQADASTTRRHGGLGLGLAIVKQLVELHGGTVRAQSEGIGKGAIFIVALPLAPLGVASERRERAHPRSKPTEVPGVPEVSLKNIRVLVVDDDPDARILLKSLLESAGAEVHLAESAKDGLQQLQRSVMDVLICDIGMREVDGYTLMRQIRMLDDSEKSEVPAVALTAYARIEDRRKAIRAGFQNHLPKPVEPAELIEIVHSLANRRSRRGPSDRGTT